MGTTLRGGPTITLATNLFAVSITDWTDYGLKLMSANVFVSSTNVTGTSEVTSRARGSSLKHLLDYRSGRQARSRMIATFDESIGSFVPRPHAVMPGNQGVACGAEGIRTVMCLDMNRNEAS